MRYPQNHVWANDPIVRKENKAVLRRVTLLALTRDQEILPRMMAKSTIMMVKKEIKINWAVDAFICVDR